MAFSMHTTPGSLVFEFCKAELLKGAAQVRLQSPGARLRWTSKFEHFMAKQGPLAFERHVCPRALLFYKRQAGGRT